MNDPVNKAREAELIEAIELGKSVACAPYLDALAYCYSPANQMSSYYRIGNVDACTVQLTDFFSCMKLKLNYAAEDKKEMKRKLLRQGSNSSTSTIWEFRSNPEENWNKQVPCAAVAAAEEIQGNGLETDPKSSS